MFLFKFVLLSSLYPPPQKPQNLLTPFPLAIKSSTAKSPPSVSSRPTRSYPIAPSSMVAVAAPMPTIAMVVVVAEASRSKGAWSRKRCRRAAQGY